MVNFLPHVDLIPAETQNRINLLMGAAQKQLIKQFENKIIEYSLGSEKRDKAYEMVKIKEK
jgi:hypothetical protein